ncbi:unnamed protein product, partial [Urochloa humidicola]
GGAGAAPTPRPTSFTSRVASGRRQPLQRRSRARSPPPMARPLSPSLPCSAACGAEPVGQADRPRVPPDRAPAPASSSAAAGFDDGDLGGKAQRRVAAPAADERRGAGWEDVQASADLGEYGEDLDSSGLFV